MGNHKDRHVLGRDYLDESGNAQPGFLYGGVSEREHEAAFDVGLGVYNGDQFDLLQANGQAGFMQSANGKGTQFGLQGEATSIGLQGDLIDDILNVGGVDTSGDAWWQQALEWSRGLIGYEAHGPQAKAEAHIGTEGAQAGYGVDWVGGQAKLGGAEYNSLLGTEITVGGGIAAAPALAGGLHWSDDDGDGIRELGFNVGGDAAAGLGLGMDVGIKTEAVGHLLNAGQAAWDWITGGSDE